MPSITSRHARDRYNAARDLRELGLAFPAIAPLVGIPAGTLKPLASREGWTGEESREELLQACNPLRLPGGSVPVPRSRLGLGAARLLVERGETVALLDLKDWRTVERVLQGPEDNKALVLKDMGLADLRSSGEEIEAAVDCERNAILAGIASDVASPSISSGSEQPATTGKATARRHAEDAGRAALKAAAKAPPPIKTWRDLEIAARLAGVATAEGTKDQPLINIALLNNPGEFAKVASRKTVGASTVEEAGALVE